MIPYNPRHQQTQEQALLQISCRNEVTIWARQQGLFRTKATTQSAYSSDAQRDVSIVQQKDAAHEYAKAHGYHIVKEYEDHAYSGTRDDRPGFQLMLYEVEKLRPAYLLLWKTDRLSRDRMELKSLVTLASRSINTKLMTIRPQLCAAYSVNIRRASR